jgi:hypothetical protein
MKKGGVRSEYSSSCERATAAPEYFTMNLSSTEVRVVPVPQAGDVLTELLREGAQRLLAQAIDAELSDWIDPHRHCVDEQGHRQVVRNGYLPERVTTTGVGSV